VGEVTHHTAKILLNVGDCSFWFNVLEGTISRKNRVQMPFFNDFEPNQTEKSGQIPIVE
jgi:hypothetical protein